MRSSAGTLLMAIAGLSLAGVSPFAGAETEHPPLVRYAVYTFDPYGNAEYAFDFELLTRSSPGQPGHYELQLGPIDESEVKAWRGTYEFDPATVRLRWLSGPFEHNESFRQDAKNPEGGKLVVKNGRWTVFLNGKTRGTSLAP